MSFPFYVVMTYLLAQRDRTYPASASCAIWTWAYYSYVVCSPEELCWPYGVVRGISLKGSLRQAISMPGPDQFSMEQWIPEGCCCHILIKHHLWGSQFLQLLKMPGIIWGPWSHGVCSKLKRAVLTENL